MLKNGQYFKKKWNASTTFVILWGILIFGALILWDPFSLSLAMDYVSKWVEAKATRNDFVNSHTFCKFVIPRAIICDQGTNFCNGQMEALLRKYGVFYKVSTPYYPQTNGQAEISNRKVKQILEKIIQLNRKD